MKGNEEMDAVVACRYDTRIECKAQVMDKKLVFEYMLGKDVLLG